MKSIFARSLVIFGVIRPCMTTHSVDISKHIFVKIWIVLNGDFYYCLNPIKVRRHWPKASKQMVSVCAILYKISSVNAAELWIPRRLCVAIASARICPRARPFHRPTRAPPKSGMCTGRGVLLFALNFGRYVPSASCNMFVSPHKYIRPHSVTAAECEAPAVTRTTVLSAKWRMSTGKARDMFCLHTNPVDPGPVDRLRWIQRSKFDCRLSEQACGCSHRPPGVHNASFGARLLHCVGG